MMIIVLVIVVYADGFVSKSLNCHVRACCLTNHLLPPVIYHSALVLQAKETTCMHVPWFNLQQIRQVAASLPGYGWSCIIVSD